VPIAEIMGWFCQGYGFGEIDQVYSLRSGDLSVEAIFASRSTGQGMGEIKQDLTLPSEKNKPVKANNSANENKPANAASPEKDPKPTKAPKP